MILGLAALALLAIVSPGLWLNLWKIGVLAMAVLAPVLGVSRTARSVVRSSVETEFARWFQPFDAEASRDV